MARTLDQILAELAPTYDPQVATIRQRQEAIPGQIAEEEKALDAKKEAAFARILGGARQRGLGFSGIPLSEQAQYASTEYAPALARNRLAGHERALSLEDAILGIQERRTSLGRQIYDSELNRDLEQQRLAEQQRQFNENLAFQRQEAARAAKAASSGGFSIGGGGMAPAAAPKVQAVSQFKNGKDGTGGFAFADAAGRPISAAKYAQLTGRPIGEVLYEMGRAGDKLAMQTYNAMKAAPGVARRPAALFWGL